MPIIEETGEAPKNGAHMLKISIRVPKYAFSSFVPFQFSRIQQITSLLPYFRALHGFIIGKKGQTRSRLEHETMTRIVIPRRDEEGDIGNFQILLPCGIKEWAKRGTLRPYAQWNRDIWKYFWKRIWEWDNFKNLNFSSFFPSLWKCAFLSVKKSGPAELTR